MKTFETEKTYTKKSSEQRQSRQEESGAKPEQAERDSGMNAARSQQSQPQQSQPQERQRQQGQPKQNPSDSRQGVPSSDEMKGMWKQQVGKAKVIWGKLTDDELLKSEGHQQKLTGLVQERYAISRDEAEKQVKNFLAKCKIA